MSKQPRDDANAAIPVLSYRPGTGRQLTITSSSIRSSAFAGPTRVISIYTDVDCFIEIGGPDVEANLTNSHLIPAGIYMDISLGDRFISSENSKFLAVIGNSSGTLYISERE
jgi:hypothetical protein